MDDATLLEASTLGEILGEIILLDELTHVEVMENAAELVKTMPGWKMLVEIAQVVLAELAGREAERLQQASKRRILFLHADGRSR